MTGTVVAIHQPNFFPWLGFFNKLALSDTFVLLDDVQFTRKSGGSWTNRVKVLCEGEARWLTAPVDRRYHGLKQIADIRLDSRTPWREKSIRVLQNYYRRAPRFAEGMAIVEPLLRHEDERLGAFNEHALRVMAEIVGLDSGRIIRSSDLGVTGVSTERLVNLVRACGGDTYLSGGGSAGYQDDREFDRAGLKVRYQEFRHPTYCQGLDGTFVPGLSILDALMHCGVSGLARLVAGG